MPDNYQIAEPKTVANTAKGAAQSNAAALPALAGLTTYITGFDVTGGGATGASIVAEDLQGGGYRYARGVLIVGTNAVLIAMIAHGSVGRYKPETNTILNQEIAGVTQTIADTN